MSLSQAPVLSAPPARAAGRCGKPAALLRCAAALLLGLAALWALPLAVAQDDARGQAPSAAPDLAAAAAAPVAAPPGTQTAAAAADGPPPACSEAPVGVGPSLPVAPGLVAAIGDRVRRRVGGEVSSVCPTPFGLFEVVVDAEVVYVDERVNYLIAGNAFDLRTQQNLTARRKEDITRVDFQALPLELAVKTVRGNGARTMAVFEDPNCPYCKRFENDIANLNDITIYTFLYPILSQDATLADDSYPKSRAIWCAADRAAAWSQVMITGKRLPAPSDSCKSPLEAILALGQKLHITGTPTLLFVDGRRSQGALPADQIEKIIATALAPGLSSHPVSH